ncbi:TRAP transporter substrate-binding protein [Arenicella xantha]|uniref:TRAP-type mannitol/chloroaromatic compound transport system substrate-binding protein n=1 Tax=Arenicella xantha TaxID=644221 RepID=A0A395JHS2_9GAMM|nr:TRAP transporter substrate-binding protein DctP [Arenicella xantha]RBP48433.1 TRAP-type mannitol/chloroaromatic compound transport system substrate-binding protein [Arenicella xantha]
MTHSYNFKAQAVVTLRACLTLAAVYFLTACTASDSNPEAATTQTKQEKITLSLAHGWPKGFPVFGESVERYKELVEELSDGRIIINVDSANRHKSAFGIFDFVKSGQYDIGQSASYYYGGKDPDALFFSSMPFDMTEQEQTAWFYEGGGLELANEVYAKHNIEVMLGGNTGMQMGGWFRKEINSVDDLKGLKMRIPGFGGKVIAGVGAVPTNIPAGELYQALERGTIDALEWVGPGLDLRMGFHKVAPYYYTGWHEPGTELLYFFNRDSMNKLPNWAQSILRNAAKLTAYNMTTSSFAANADNWATISSQFPDVKVKQFPPEVVQALKASNQALLDAEVQRSPVAEKILASRAAYLKKARAWTEVGEQAYLESMAN